MSGLIDLGKQWLLQQRRASKGDLLPVAVCLQPEQPRGRVFPNLRCEAVRRRTRVETSRVPASSVEEQEVLTGRIPRLFICLCVAGGHGPPRPLLLSF